MLHVDAHNIFQTVLRASQSSLKTVRKSLTQGTSLGLAGVQKNEVLLCYLSDLQVIRTSAFIVCFTLYWMFSIPYPHSSYNHRFHDENELETSLVIFAQGHTVNTNSYSLLQLPARPFRYVKSNFPTIPYGRHYYYSQFAYGETEAWKSYITYPRSHSYKWQSWNLNPRMPEYKAQSGHVRDPWNIKQTFS